MSSPSPTTLPATPLAQLLPLAAENAMAVPAISLRRVVATEILMPFEAVAKAIFVKANGLPAYYKATGIGRRLTDAAMAGDRRIRALLKDPLLADQDRRQG